MESWFHSAESRVHYRGTRDVGTAIPLNGTVRSQSPNRDDGTDSVRDELRDDVREELHPHDYGTPPVSSDVLNEQP